MAPVISNENRGNHTVSKYSFKVLAVGSHEPLDDIFESSLIHEKKDEYTHEVHPDRRESDIDASAMSQSSKDSLIESLMKKTDEMSSNFIKLQMKLEDMTDEHKKELIKVEEDSFANGVEAGKKLSLEEGDNNITEAIKQFSSSVATLESTAKEFDSALEGIKKELISAAIDISKEVINIELSENSNHIATVLSNELIKELQSASKIKLKVNPKDHGALSENLGSMQHVEIVSDSAVSQGGVIAISDAGNIDAEISKRFERVKRAALSE
ncbi:flagellar assembly protein FliH [Candidatus Sulfurimonas marisnigri]|uniref:Flagellar assembly protein FliH n=1 Tax=Candidatus Sulfurimonas marisnigri TaxID=2740405 RepID=A0A7S7RQZ0_9BACT|nr:flagellar assembly protein FliH [Candidatus Sulfurimonas marisnigri]QOY55078.1 flagellar assembly protein FliH [Candidatus Sulfurimonas marisnigri]